MDFEITKDDDHVCIAKISYEQFREWMREADYKEEAINSFTNDDIDELWKYHNINSNINFDMLRSISWPNFYDIVNTFLVYRAHKNKGE